MYYAILIIVIAQISMIHAAISASIIKFFFFLRLWISEIGIEPIY